MAPLILCWLAYYGALGLYFPFLTLYLTSGLGLAPHVATALFAIMPAMTLLVPPLVGLVADAQRARTRLMRRCATLGALGFLLFVIATPPVAGGRLVVLAAGFLLYSATRAAVTSMLDAIGFEVAEHNGTHFGRLRLWGSLAFALAVLGGGRAIATIELHGLLWLALGATVVLAAGTFALPPPERLATPHATAAWRELIADRRARWLFVAVVIAHTAGSSYDGCYSLYVVSLGFSNTHAGALWAVGVFAEIVLLYYSDALAQRVGEARLLVGALLIAALRWWLIALAGTLVSLPLLYIAQPLHGVSFGLVYVGAARAMRALAPRLPTASQGLLSSAFGLGGVFGLLSSGRLFEAGGGQLVFGVAGVLALIAAGVAALLAPPAAR